MEHPDLQEWGGRKLSGDVPYMGLREAGYTVDRDCLAHKAMLQNLTVGLLQGLHNSTGWRGAFWMQCAMALPCNAGNILGLERKRTRVFHLSNVCSSLPLWGWGET